MDWLFRKAGAHGKQALTMAMGFGCNAAGVIATRVIDSPRERLIAILTNNFVPCNGRYPTLIMLAVIFVGAAFPPAFAAVAAAGAVVGIVALGVVFTLLVSWALTRTVLQGEASAFTLELPPYRRPSILRILYTSLIDRTLFVLWRAILTAAPAGAVIWLLANIDAGRPQLGAARHRLSGTIGLRNRAGRRDHPGVHHRDPRQRDRRADHHDVLPRRGRNDGDHRVRGHPAAAGGRARLDDADGRQPDALFAAAQPLRNDHHHHLEGDAQRSLDDHRRVVAVGDRLRGLLRGGVVWRALL
jgi:hypothetical protein